MAIPRDHDVMFSYKPKQKFVNKRSLKLEKKTAISISFLHRFSSDLFDAKRKSTSFPPNIRSQAKDEPFFLTLRETFQPARFLLCIHSQVIFIFLPFVALSGLKIQIYTYRARRMWFHMEILPNCYSQWRKCSDFYSYNKYHTIPSTKIKHTFQSRFPNLVRFYY